MGVKERTEKIKQQMEKARETNEGFDVDFEERCDKCGKQYVGLEISVKLPELIVLCTDCLPKDVNLDDWILPYKIGEL